MLFPLHSCVATLHVFHRNRRLSTYYGNRKWDGEDDTDIPTIDSEFMGANNDCGWGKEGLHRDRHCIVL